MPLTLRKDSGWWYADFVHDGKRRVIRLNITVEGTRPPTLHERGDDKFERSRARASLVLEQTLKELKQPQNEADRLKRIHEIETGTPLSVAFPPENLFDEWRTASSRRKGGRKKRSDSYVDQVKTLTEKFATFLKKEAKIYDARRIRPATIIHFLDTTLGPKATGKSWNNNLAALAAVFRAAQRAHDFPFDPFKKVSPRPEDESVSRCPYGVEEIGRILLAASTDEIAGAVAITAATTGMRRKDCAILRWAHVDLDRGFIKVTASKTGEALDIPILPPLRRCLERALAQKDASGICFPKAAAMYVSNPDGLTVRLRRILQAAGITRGNAPALPEDETSGRLRKAPELGFHNFKTSFITMALNAGVPIELLKKIVGNSTVEIVLKHYYHPDSEKLAEVLNQKMPHVLTELAPKPAPISPESHRQLILLAEGLNEDNWSTTKLQFLALLRAA
jgi:integrase